LKTSPAGRIFIQKFEGLRLIAYKDIANIWTIGYGHTKGVEEGQVIDLVQAEEFFTSDLLPGEEAITATKNYLLQFEFDALSSFIFNIGVNRFKKSTLFRYLYSKDYLKAADELPKWNKARVKGELRPVSGLTRRRSAERNLFLRGIYD